MAKRVKAIVKLQIPAGKATPAQPIGPALGQHGINIMGFCKEYNERTASMAAASYLPLSPFTKIVPLLSSLRRRRQPTS